MNLICTSKTSGCGSAGFVSAVMAVAIGEGTEGAGHVIDRMHD